ncbi:late embryogenesis abundant protein [Striga asiatica]|uniref:Late embryogenesis abundant protein n=1 Tax=Striga asiatica TaxID=4170 RepID=A0A5A7QRZ6_STRAF|nr:late embryogenesis abundant protein [Striga asiatica]
MFRQERETNPHFLPRHTNNDPVIDFSRQRTPPPHRPRPPPPQHHHSPTSIAPRPPPPQHPPKPLSPTFLRGPTSRPTRPMAWLVAALCALFWMIVIVAGLIILIVYLVFQPKLPRFDLSAATLNSAYLDLGYLLNADITLLANFTNPNTKVDVDFTYIVLDVYYEKNIIVTRYVSPFSVRKRESRFADVHMVASQVKLSTLLSLELQRQMENGRVRFEVKVEYKGNEA